MVLPVSNIFSRVQSNPPHRPILNSVPIISTPTPSMIGSFNTMYNRFWKQFKTTPELIAVINLIITDIIGDRPNFVAKDGSTLGRNKRIEAKKFWAYNRVKETLKAILLDMFITGDGYGWIGKLSKEQRLEVAKEVAQHYKFTLNIKESEKNALQIKIAQDEDLKKPKKFDYLAASTVKIDCDNFDVNSYTQNSNGITTRFSIDEVIHFRFQTADGKVEGFSPFEALAKEILLIWFIKQNMLSFMENGGSAGKIITLEDTKPGTPAYQRIEEQFLGYKGVTARHGTILGTGKINVQDLDKELKDMEYKELALYITSNIAFAFNIPITRIPFLIGKSATSGDSGGMAESGYWNMISEKQDMIEDLMNSQLFDKLGWNIVLPRKYKQDEVREATTSSMNTDTITKIQSIYKMVKKKLKVDKINRMISGDGFTITDEDLEDMTDEDMMNGIEKTGLRNQNMLDNMSVEKEPDNRKRADTKRNTANESANKGMGV